MPVKKSQLYSSIWKACDELRGGMDASQYKDYVLVLLFVRYVSDKYDGKTGSIVDIPEGGGFSDLVALKGKKDIGEGINTVLDKLAKANGLSGVINSVDFDDEEKLGKGKEKQDRLSKLVGIFENPELDFSSNKSDGDDLLGDAYEYLMKHFAVESGKSKGQFYTPAEVSRIMAKVIGAENATDRTQSVYDPTCGSGSLLLKVAAEAKPVDISIFGQEKENTTAALAILNMWLHGEPTAVIKKGQSTLSDPLFTVGNELKTFDYVVANPPFSYKSWRNGFTPESDDYKRFEGFGIPPSKNGDYAFLLHVIKSMKSTGKGAIILPHGVLFRGNSEAYIRTNLIKRGYIKGIIGLPANLFYGTGIPACIIVLDKEDAQDRKGIFMIDASKGFIKDGNKNRLREQDIHKIVDVFTKQIDTPKFSRFVPLNEIEEKAYNLNIPRYIDSQEEEDLQDIEAHLLGGIPNVDIDALQKYWSVYPTLREQLFSSISRNGYSGLNVKEDQIKQTVFSHQEFISYREKVQQVFNKWKVKNKSLLTNLKTGFNPKNLIHEFSEDLVETFSNLDLIDKYDVYQHLMTYWNQIMQDDAYIISIDGWNAEVTAITNKNGNTTGWESILLPKELVINRYFSDEKSQIKELQDSLEEITQSKQDLEDEHSGEEGLLEEVKSEAGNITKVNVTKRIKEIKGDPDYEEEQKVIQDYLTLLEKESATKSKIKSAEDKLDQQLLVKYKALTEEEIIHLVINDKWMGTLEQLVQSEMDRISQKLTQRVKDLAKRYENTLPKLDKEAKDLAQKVDDHLKKMGFSW